MPGRGKYASQRARRTPPHVSLGDVRKALGLTMDEVIERIGEQHPELRPTRGAISAIESGLRGVSEQMLDALCVGYGLPAGAITVDYQPRSREVGE